MKPSQERVVGQDAKLRAPKRAERFEGASGEVGSLSISLIESHDSNAIL